MSDPLEKQDYSPRRIYSGFLQSRQTIPPKDPPRDSGPPARYYLTLRFEGNLPEAESQEFTTFWNEYAGLVRTSVRRADHARMSDPWSSCKAGRFARRKIEIEHGLPLFHWMR
jgi:hypothetical protein